MLLVLLLFFFCYISQNSWFHLLWFFLLFNWWEWNGPCNFCCLPQIGKVDMSFIFRFSFCNLISIDENMRMDWSRWVLVDWGRIGWIFTAKFEEVFRTMIVMFGERQKEKSEVCWGERRGDKREKRPVNNCREYKYWHSWDNCNELWKCVALGISDSTWIV